MSCNKRWHIICQTDGLVETVSESTPTVCPNNAGHTIGEVRWVGNASARCCRTETGAYTVKLHDDIIFCDGTGGSFSVTLPTAVNSAGIKFEIKKIDSSGNIITIDPDGSELIDGETTQVLSNQYDCITITSDGSNWDIL